MPTAPAKQIAEAIINTGGIDTKQAVAIAFRTFGDFFPKLANANLMLEEIEEGTDQKSWHVTLGYDAKRTLSPHDKMFKSEMYRAYKTFKIDRASGNVASMKIRVVD